MKSTFKSATIGGPVAPYEAARVSSDRRFCKGGGVQATPPFQTRGRVRTPRNRKFYMPAKVNFCEFLGFLFFPIPQRFYGADHLGRGPHHPLRSPPRKCNTLETAASWSETTHDLLGPARQRWWRDGDALVHGLQVCTCGVCDACDACDRRHMPRVFVGNVLWRLCVSVHTVCDCFCVRIWGVGVRTWKPASICLPAHENTSQPLKSIMFQGNSSIFPINAQREYVNTGFLFFSWRFLIQLRM